jgi:type VI secretion system protein VasD
MMFMYRITLMPLLLTLGLLAGCSAISPFSTLTKLDLVLTASEQVNPDLHGRPSPVVLQLIELRHGAAFENTDFFSLYDHAEQVLAKDWVSSEEIELRPGDRLALKLSVGPKSHFVGVLAAYRDLPHVQWRLLVPLTAQLLNRVELVLDHDGIRLADPRSGKEVQ